MARYKLQGIARDGAGNIIADASVSVYLAGTTTAASVYEASSGGTAVNSVDTDDEGFYELYVDSIDYPLSQNFKITISKSGYTSKTFDEIDIFPGLPDYEIDVSSIYGNGSKNATILNTAITAVGTIDKMIFVLYPGVWTIDTDVTVPANICLKVPNGAVLQIQTGQTVTINGPFQAGLYQVFDCVGSVVFGSGSVSEVYPEWWGAKGDGITDCSEAIQAAVDTLTTLGGGTLHFSPTDSSYLIDSISSTAESSIKLQIDGSLKHKDNSTGDMFEFSSMKSVVVKGGYIDGNYANQNDKRILFDLAGSLNVNIDGVRFENVHYGAIYTGKYLDNANIVNITNCSFKDGVLHNGILNDITCIFINAYPAALTNIENCSFVQTAAPIAGQSRNPCGILAGSASDTIKTTLSVRNCYFENLGCHCAGNILGAVEVYSYRDTVQIENNTFKSCIMIPVRVTNAGTVSILNNTIFQDVDMIIDGGTTYTSAGCIVVGLLTRGYATNERDNNSYNVQNNSIFLSGGGLNVLMVIYAYNTSTDPAYSVKNVTIRNNFIKYSTSLGNSGIYLVDLESVTVDNNRLINCNGVRITGSIVASISGVPLNYVVSNSYFESDAAADFGVESRLANPNINITIENCNFEGIKTNYSFTVRNAGNLTVHGCKFGTNSNSNGDAVNLALFIFKDNYQGYSACPANYTTCTKYRIFNNSLCQDTSEIWSTITPSGTTGAQTINKLNGSVNFAAGESSLVVTNNLVSDVTSIVVATVGTDDVTMKSVTAYVESNKFTLIANAAATAETIVYFTVVS